ncbi:conserved hypothetical protein [Hahella chejuensis KCTC 2396]|uniref:Uncharacterized protein n=1 Tax=Hahella chejuensis (strain KCTC 2396) TaxID=349521 RepID=Q2SNL0_HAHCH|nr:type III secretion system chaperone [Hahella chejuensis]ABC27764.1 conserved hypothetical protein [Hahella chejuensis KCTC 2396]
MTLYQTHIHQLLQLIGNRCGVDLTLKNGYCTLSFDQESRLHVQVGRDSETVVFRMPLTQPPNVNREAFYAKLLNINSQPEATLGAWLALSEHSGAVELCMSREALSLDDSEMAAILLNMMDLRQSLRQELETPQSTPKPCSPHFGAGVLHARHQAL